MPRIIRNRLALALLGLSLTLCPFAGRASAQATGDRTGSMTGTDSGTTATRTDRDDDGFNPGWLGLIGLAGLAGLMPRKNHAVTTHRTGDTSSR
ncbi:WGxxGxxG family protein [Paludisphaera soli]|uniref:WGxxGxxG family protein n=1 Tax=Paludisphaera soli TaxID=2712865 RepID=UPI0013EE3B92|nr:WGxxGxxG family protein [Paludisphaera soli]